MTSEDFLVEDETTGTECSYCGDVVSPDQLFNDLCERCSLEHHAEGPFDDYSFVRDFRL